MDAQACLKCKKETIREQINRYKNMRDNMKKDFKTLNKFIESQQKKYKLIEDRLDSLKTQMARIEGLITGKDEDIPKKMLTDVMRYG